MSEADRPKVVSSRTLTVALVLHVVFFGGVWGLTGFEFTKPDPVIPIELTVIVNENLDGVENEPPPLDDPPPPPEPKPPKPEPKPLPPKPVEEPKELEKIVTNIVKKVDKKKLEEERIKKMRESVKLPEKKDEPKIEKPKEKPLTKEERLKKRMEEMRKSATVKNVKIKIKGAESGNGRTDKQTMSEKEIRDKLKSGYRAGTSNQLAASEEQRCVSIIQRTYEDKWDEVGRPAWTSDLKVMQLKVKFAAGGRVTGYSLVAKSGDAKADQTVLRAAQLVKVVSGLSDAFIAKNKDGVIVRFKVVP